MSNTSIHPLTAEQVQGIIARHSPYLSQLAHKHADILSAITAEGYDHSYASLVEQRECLFDYHLPRESLMKELRHAKARLALFVALADIAGAWTLEQVTRALSDFAVGALQACIRHLLFASHTRGEIALPNPEKPEFASGLIILGMGKLGGRELNYSSDIDLIVFFEPTSVEYKGRQTLQHCFSRLAQDLVQMMQQRTSDGYVFRTDLRLRPDPASTPPAITTDAALYYYESVGQNWERAALIKARPVAGDLEAGQQFLRQIVPFIWRKHLDFAAIQDIQSIKRQMDGRQAKAIQLAGHNVKIGLGGIREIEFYTQIHQLIWGGRRPELRSLATCNTLDLLVEDGLVEAATRDMLIESYRFLRMVEHRLQMVDDQQTHSMPTEADKLKQIALFCGYDSQAAFEKTLLDTLTRVHAIFSASFRSGQALSDEGGNLVFTGVSNDPETLQTLTNMGFFAPERVSEMIMGWHHGSHRCTRSKRARELITELMPRILRALAATSNPDAAFLKFNEFLAGIPAGVQLFSLFSQNPQLLELIADIMGSAPSLAETLSKSPELLDLVLYGDFYGELPSTEKLRDELSANIRYMEDFEIRMDALRRFKKEKQFQAGVQLLKGKISGEAIGCFLSDVAEVTLEQALADVEAEFARTYGHIPEARFAVIALGKLGSREMAFGSDIDLMFIYDVPDFERLSDGGKGFTASVYYNRLTQRLINALTAMSREGVLYVVDTRLRPSGKQGPMAVSLKAFSHYFDELAWTFEFMVLTRARTAAGDVSLAKELEQAVAAQLCKPRPQETLLRDVREMRHRVAAEHSPDDCWDLKHVRGGLIELDFIVQTLMLLYAHRYPVVLARTTGEGLTRLHHEKLISDATYAELSDHNRFLLNLLQVIRLTAGSWFDEAHAMPGLKKLLAESLQYPDFESLKKKLLLLEEQVHRHYMDVLNDNDVAPAHH